MTAIIEVDPHDDAQLRGFWRAEHAAIRADRAHPVIRTYDALAAAVRNPTPYVRRTLLAAVADGRVVGGVEIAMPQQENTHLGEVEVNVVPEVRRRGLGTALHDAAVALLTADGRTTYTGEAYAPAAGEAGAVAFAQGAGYASVHVEDHLVLPLPVPGRRMTDLRAALPDDTGYDVVTWGGHCPDELLTAYCAPCPARGTR